MQKNLQDKIDLLVEMSGTNNTYDMILEELNNVLRDIDYKKSEVKKAKLAMHDDKYLRNNDRIIDENIKIGLENKRCVYEIELETVLKKLEHASLNEEDAHASLMQTTNRLKSLYSLLEALEEKIKSVHQNKELNKFYEELIEKTNKEIIEEEKKKEILAKNYQNAEEKLLYYGEDKNELEKKINKINNRLEETIVALSTPNFYVDKLLKKKDEELVDKLNKELEELENQKLKLITDPAYIGHEAMRLFNEDDITSSLSSIKELVTIDKSMPYIEVPDKEIDEILEKTIEQRDELASLIENNPYIGVDNKIIDKRIDYLKEQIDKIKEEKKIVEDKIKEIDTKEVLKVSDSLNEAISIYQKLKEQYEEYKEVIYNTNEDNVTPRRKVILQASYSRKKEELEQIEKIINKYQIDLEKLVLKSKELETKTMIFLDESIKNIEDEIDTLKKEKNNKSHTKDVLAMEKDKEQLKKLDDEVSMINHRKKFKKSVDKIYQEIEELLRKEEKEETIKEDDYINLDDFHILDEKEEEEKEVDNTVSLEEFTLPTEAIKAEDDLEDTKVFPPRKSLVENNRFKVVNVEPLPEDESKENSEVKENKNEEIEELEIEPVFKSKDLDDTEEYISFNDLLNGGI